MIVVAGSVTIRHEHREEAIRAALTLAEATRAEPGCLAYRFSFDLAEPDTIWVFEEWESDEALERHFQTEHMRVFRARAAELVASPPSIKRYVVESASAMA